MQRKEGIQLASVYGQIEVVKFMAINGVNIHAQDDQAFRFAATNRQVERG
jgi:hypothetical protein